MLYLNKLIITRFLSCNNPKIYLPPTQPPQHTFTHHSYSPAQNPPGMLAYYTLRHLLKVSVSFVVPPPLLTAMPL